MLDGIARFFQGRAVRVLVVPPGMRRQLAERGFDERRLVFLPNGADTELFRPRAVPAERAAGRPFTLLYAGTHGLVHGMDALLDAAELLQGEDVVFRFVGDGVARDALVRSARERGLSNCTFEPSVPPEALVELLHDAGRLVLTAGSGEAAGGEPAEHRQGGDEGGDAEDCRHAERGNRGGSGTRCQGDGVRDAFRCRPFHACAAQRLADDVR